MKPSQLYISTIENAHVHAIHTRALNIATKILSNNKLLSHGNFAWHTLTTEQSTKLITNIESNYPEIDLEVFLTALYGTIKFCFALDQVSYDELIKLNLFINPKKRIQDINPSDIYINSLKSNASRTAMASTLNCCTQILSGLDDMDAHRYNWSTLSYNDIHTILNNLTNKKYSPQTLNRYLSALKGVAKYAYKSGLISNEDHEHIKEIKGTKGSHKSKGRALEMEELNALLDHCFHKEGSKALRDATVMALIYGSGLRRSEAANLTFSALDLKERTIKILGKGNKTRVISLNERTSDMLNLYLEMRGHDEGPLFVRIKKGGAVTKLPISPQAIYDIVIMRYKEAGLTRLSPHDLRHTFATSLLESGTTLAVVQQLLDHENIETTTGYLHMREKDKKDASTNLKM